MPCSVACRPLPSARGRSGRCRRRRTRSLARRRRRARRVRRAARPVPLSRVAGAAAAGGPPPRPSADCHHPDDHERGHQRRCRKTVTASGHDLELPYECRRIPAKLAGSRPRGLQRRMPTRMAPRLGMTVSAVALEHGAFRQGSTRGQSRGYSILWQVSQSWQIVLPSFDLWLSSWQRKHPGKSMWPMLFG